MQAERYECMKKEELKNLVPHLSDEEMEKILALYEEKIAQQRVSESEVQAEEIREAAYRDAMREAEEKFAKQELERMIGAELEKANSRSPEVLKALINTDSITLEDGKLSGLSEQLEKLRNEYGFIFFEDEEKPRFTKELIQGAADMDLSKLSYKDRLKLYSEMPELYSRLVK